MAGPDPGPGSAGNLGTSGRTALTGTPGTGKTTLAALLRERGFPVVMGDELARDSGALGRYNSRRQTQEVDLARLNAALVDLVPLILVAHYAHRLEVHRAIVLRCHPKTLRERLRGRGWPPEKILENLEAEALSVITSEALERLPTYEVDTTNRSPSETLQGYLEILQGRGAGHEAPVVDWSEVILDWF